MMGASYKTKKALKESIGQPRKWFASVTMKDGLIAKVS